MNENYLWMFIKNSSKHLMKEAIIPLEDAREKYKHLLEEMMERKLVH